MTATVHSQVEYGLRYKSFSGAGIQNLGNLTLNNVVVRDNQQNRDISGGTLAGGRPNQP